MKSFTLASKITLNDLYLIDVVVVSLYTVFTAESHDDKCPGVEVKCTLGCSSHLLRRQLQQHIDEQCKNTIVKCTAHEFDCAAEGKRSIMKGHISTCPLVYCLPALLSFKKTFNDLNEKIKAQHIII